MLAAGRSSRFGENKLMVSLQNKPLVGYVLDVLQGLSGIGETAVVVSDPKVADYVNQRGLRSIINAQPELGMAHSIVLGVQAMQDMDAVLLVAGDQPLLTRASLSRLIDAYREGKQGIACLRDGTHMGNPAIFSSIYYRELMKLAGDHGAGSLLRQHGEDVRAVDCLYADELEDADTREALACMEQSLRNRCCGNG